MWKVEHQAFSIQLVPLLCETVFYYMRIYAFSQACYFMGLRLHVLDG